MTVFKHFLLFAIIILLVGCNSSPKIKTEKTTDLTHEIDSVKSVMKNYINAIESLSVNKKTASLFSEDSEIYESGGFEGSFTNYAAHHLTPELNNFDSFIFSDYNITVKIDLPYAFTTETYIYTISFKNKKKEVQIIHKKGVATSILKKINGAWKIIKTHSSSRSS